MKIGVIVYPGSNCDADTFYALDKIMGYKTRYIWYQDNKVDSLDVIVLPGGFSYGDYLRCGAIAQFASVSKVIKEHARKGKYIIGICNGFQILTELRLLPGALIRNTGLKFICKDVYLKVENKNTAFTNKIQTEIVRIPIAHGEGNYRIDEVGLKTLYDHEQVIFKYSGPKGEINNIYNPNGSMDNIAGICNKEKNILGMMPHPERVCEQKLGGIHGKMFFSSLQFA